MQFGEYVILKVLLLTFAIFIAYQIGRVGRRRMIGFNWSFYFGLLHPILALILVFSSKKTPPPERKKRSFIRFIAICLILFGVIRLFTGMATGYTQAQLIKPEATEEYTFFDASADGVGALLGGGSLSILYNTELLMQNDLVLYRYNRILLGIILISIGVFLLRKQRIALPATNDIATSEGLEQQKISSSSINYTSKWKFSMATLKARIYLYSGISLVLGFLLGWYFKVPNESLLIALSKSDSEWRKDLKFEYAKTISSFFSTEYFSFNWTAFIFGTIFFLFCLILLDKYNAFQTLKEKLSTQSK